MDPYINIARKGPLILQRSHVTCGQSVRGIRALSSALLPQLVGAVQGTAAVRILKAFVAVLALVPRILTWHDISLLLLITGMVIR